MRNHLVVNERREVFAISEISINWDIRVEQEFCPSSFELQDPNGANTGST